MIRTEDGIEGATCGVVENVAQNQIWQKAAPTVFVIMAEANSLTLNPTLVIGLKTVALR